MARLLKLISIGIVILVVTLVVGVFVFVDPNDFRPVIIKQVKNATGRDLTIDGNLSLSFTPWLGVKTGAIQLSNAPGFGKQPFARVESSNIRIKLLPLLHKKYELDTITLNGLQLDLQKHKDGRTNWADLAQPSQGKQKSAASGNAQNVLAALAIGGVNLTDAKIMWHDQQANQRVTVDHVNLSTGAVRPGKPVDIDLKLSVAASNPAMTGDIRFSGTARANPFAGSFGVDKMDLEYDLKGKTLPNGQLKGNLKTDLAGDMIKQIVTLKKLVASVKSEGPQGIDATLNTAASFNLKNEALRLDGLKADVTASGDQFPGKQLRTTLSGNIDANLARQTVRSDNLTVSALGINMQGKLVGINLFSDKRRIDMPVKVERVNPRELLKQLGQSVPETADPKALSQASMSAAISLAGNNLLVKNISLALDDSKITGDLGITNLSNPSINYNLIVDSINVDRYLPPSAQRQPQKTAFSLSPISVTQAATTPEPLLPLETLRGINASGTLRVNQLIASNIHSKSITMNTSAHAGIIRLSPISALLYNGRYHGNITINASKQFGDKPLISIDESLLGISLGPLLKDLNGEQRISGTADLKARLSARGNDLDTLKRNLQGDLKSGKGVAVIVNNGVFRGTNVLDQLLRFIALATSTPVPPSNNKNETRFNQLKASFDVHNGIAHTNDMNMLAPEFVLNEAGKIDLVREDMKFSGHLQVSDSYRFPNASETEIRRIRSVKIPVKVECNYTNIDRGCFTYSIKEVAEAYLQQVIKDKAKKELLKQIAPKPTPGKPESSKDKLKRKLLDKLFGK